MSAHFVDEHVGKKLRHYRLLKDFTQKEVADELGVSFQQLQKYEMGANRVSASKLFEIAKVLDVPISAFFPEEADAPESTNLNSDEAALIRAYRASPAGVRSAIHSLASSLEAA